MCVYLCCTGIFYLHCRPQWCPVLYLIAVHHVHSFVFSQHSEVSSNRCTLVIVVIKSAVHTFDIVWTAFEWICEIRSTSVKYTVCLRTSVYLVGTCMCVTNVLMGVLCVCMCVPQMCLFISALWNKALCVFLRFRILEHLLTLSLSHTLSRSLANFQNTASNILQRKLLQGVLRVRAEVCLCAYVY